MAVTGRRATMQTLIAILTLMVLSAFLPEVCSGNTPIPTFFSPATFAFLVFFGYGVPVLLIRELAVRARLTTAGILVIGFAYGSYNEGLLAQTMIHVDHIPIAAFNGYGVYASVDVPWAMTISLYHALASVLFPILIAHALFPAEAAKPWLDARLAWPLAVVVLSLATAFFFQTDHQPGAAVHAAIFLSVIVGGALLASRLRRGTDEQKIAPAVGVLPLLLGLSVLAPFAGLSLVAAAKAPIALFMLAWLFIVGAYAWVMWRCGWNEPPNLLLFALGFYGQSVLLALVLRGVTRQADPATFIGGVVLELIFIWAAVRIISGGRTVRASDSPAGA